MVETELPGTGRNMARRASVPPMPLELRVLLVLLLLDLLVGIWMRLHAERWLAFFLTHVPVLGLAGLAWGFTPGRSRRWLGLRVRSALASRPTLWTLGALGATLVLLSVLVSSVRVELVDPGVRTRVRLISGDRTLRDSTALRAADAKALNRLTAPASFPIWVTPMGRRVWVYSGSLASASTRVMPWVPTTLRYPDDFDTVSTLAALPMPTMLRHTGDSLAPSVLTIRDASDSSFLAAVPLRGMRGVLIGFPDVSRPDSAAVAAWRGRLRAFFDDEPATEEEIEGVLQLWLNADRRPSARPLVLDDLLRWEVHLADGTLLNADTTRLTHAISHVFLAP